MWKHSVSKRPDQVSFPQMNTDVREQMDRDVGRRLNMGEVEGIKRIVNGDSGEGLYGPFFVLL